MNKPQPCLLALAAVLGSYAAPLLPQNTPVVVQAKSGATGDLATPAATGGPLRITEYDSDGPSDAAQLADYQRVFSL